MSGYVPPHKRNADRNRNDNQRQSNSRFSRDDPPPQRSNRFSDRDNNRYSDRDNSTSNFSKGDIRSRGGNFNTRGFLPEETQMELSLERNEEYEKELFGSRSEVAIGGNFGEYDKIPVDVSGVDCPAGIDTFEELLTTEALLNSISLCNFQIPTPIQKYSIPTVIADRDLMACAQTGSGKTAAFLIPVIEKLCLHPRNPDRMSSRSRHLPRALILAPTRELASQIHKQARKLLYMTGLRSVCVYGGANIGEQFRQLSYGVDICVATPGRFFDMMERGKMDCSSIEYLVLDEADRMLDMGFLPQIEQILDGLPPTRRTLMYSATFPDQIQALAGNHLNDYIFIAVGRVGSTTALITQQLKYVQDRDKMDELLDLMPKITDGKALVFTATKRGADRIARTLQQRGLNATTIHGDKSQHEREAALEFFRSGECNVLVATDVAARGLDIPNVLYVVQYDLPGNIDDYVHRIGRTGRRGNVGTAIGFTNEGNRPILEELLRLLRESKQEVPSWFTRLIKTQQQRGMRPNRSQGGRNGGRQSYGGRDVRPMTRNAEPAKPQQKKVRQKKKAFSNDGW